MCLTSSTRSTYLSPPIICRFEQVFKEMIDGKWSKKWVCLVIVKVANYLVLPSAMSSESASIRSTLCTRPTLGISFVQKAFNISPVGLALKTLNSRYGMLVKIQCMEILSMIMEGQVKEIGIFLGDCINYCSKFSRLNEVCWLCW